MTANNVNYYRQRADEEMAAAERCSDSSIAQIHREMAQRYRALINPETDRTAVDAAATRPVGGSFAEPGIILG